MKDKFKSVLRYIVLFALVTAVLTAVLVGAAMITKPAIQENMEETAVYLCEKETVHRVVQSLRISAIDRYADTITLSIAYYLDEAHPLESVMWSNYYGSTETNINEYFLRAVKENPPPNMEYLRYWHGPAAYLRLLHTVCSLKTIYTIDIILMAGLYCLLIVYFLKNKLKAETVSLLLALAAVSVWVTPFCLEFTWVFLCVPLSAFLAVFLVRRGKEQWLGPLFLVTGMVTVYLDFLTTETLTLLVPLLLVLRVRGRTLPPERDRDSLRLAVRCGVLWLVGYLGMWATKWALASVVLGENVLPYVTGHVAERLGGDVDVSLPRFLAGAVLKNLTRILPTEYGVFGVIVFVALVFVLVLLPISFEEVRFKRKPNRNRILLYVALGLVPYLRYLVLHNHAWIHAGFTYRAQAATVLALCFLLLELIEPVPNKKGGLRFGKSS